jgi:hypothetical protein
MAAAANVDIAMNAAFEIKKRKKGDDFEECNDAQLPSDNDEGHTPRTPIHSGAAASSPNTASSKGGAASTSPTTASSKVSSLGASASQVHAAEVFTQAPPGGHNFDSIAKMIGMSMAASMETKAKVELNTNTTNATKALVEKTDLKVTTLEGKFDSLNRRLAVVEGTAKGAAKGAAKGGKKPAEFNMSPRGADPLQGVNDPWGGSRGNRAAGLGFAPEPRQAQETNDEWAAYANNNVNNAGGARPEFKLATRPGDRTGLISGGFANDSDSEDIEKCLRTIVHGVEGVESIKSLGKFGIAGKVTFETNDLMWAFIKAHKGVKFEHNGNHRAIWYSIEKTTEERRAAAKMSAIIRGLVKHLVEIGGKDETTARRIIDSDYKRGIIVFKELPTVIDLDDDAARSRPLNRTRLIQKDYLTGVFEVLEGARAMTEFKDFTWDTLMLEANAEDKQRA